MYRVATGLAKSPSASPTLATNAVATAMEKANIQSANGVLLFVTAELVPYLKEATLAAAQVANTTQVFGCSATGIFTEEDWVLDCPAVAAIVFGGDVHLGLATQNQNKTPLLTLSTSQDSLNGNISRYGGITGDATGPANHVTWENAHSLLSKQVQTHLTGLTLASGFSHGLTMLSSPCVVDEALAFDLMRSNGNQAYDDLLKVWHHHAGDNTALPTDELIVIYADNAAAMMSGNFMQSPVMQVDTVKGHVSLATAVPSGKTMCWAFAHNSATSEVTDIAKGLCVELKTNTPAFGLCFSTMNRGPFADGIDHDLNAIKKTLPATPLIGFYGNGTIAHINDQHQVLGNTLVLNLFK